MGPKKGRKLQGRKDGEINQAMKDFENVMVDVLVSMNDGKLRGTGPNGEVIIFNPAGSGSSSGAGAGIPTVYVNGTVIRYD